MTINFSSDQVVKQSLNLACMWFYAPTSLSDFIRLDKLPHFRKTWLLVWLSVGFMRSSLPHFWSFPHIIFQTCKDGFINVDLYIFITWKWIQITTVCSAVCGDSHHGLTGLSWFQFLISGTNNLPRILVRDLRW